MKLTWISGSPQMLGQPTYEQCFREGGPQFDECWRNSFRQAQLECDQTTAGFPNYDACVNGRARNIANRVCIPACEAYLRGGSLYPWEREAQATCELQDEINVALRDQGYNPIIRDCRLGPATCGAADFLGMGVPATCVGRPWTAPTRGGAAPRPPPTPAVAKKSRAGLAGGILAAALVGLVAYTQIG